VEYLDALLNTSANKTSLASPPSIVTLCTVTVQACVPLPSTCYDTNGMIGIARIKQESAHPPQFSSCQENFTALNWLPWQKDSIAQ
jgi:hypothetical protein